MGIIFNQICMKKYQINLRVRGVNSTLAPGFVKFWAHNLVMVTIMLVNIKLTKLTVTLTFENVEIKFFKNIKLMSAFFHFSQSIVQSFR